MSLSRRAFLRTAAASVSVGGITYFLPPFPQARGADTPPPSERIRTAAIGVGNQGGPKNNLKFHAKNCVAVCDVDSKYLAAAASFVEKESGKAPFTEGDYRRILDRKDVDAVVITVRRNKRILQTGSQQRSDERFRRACEYVRSGRLGKIKEVRVGIPGPNWIDRAKKPVPDSDPPAELNYDMWLGPAPQRAYNQHRVHYLFRFFWDYSGGQVTNFGAHHLDITQWALGMDESGPTTIEGTATYNKDHWFETPEKCLITYTYPNGVKVICHNGKKEEEGCQFVGEKGTIFVDRKKIESDPAAILKDELKDTDVHLYVSKNHHANWFDCIKSRKAPIAEVEIGHRSATVCHLGNIAIRTGRKITWDPVKEQIIGDKEAAAMATKAYRDPWKLVVKG
jgi:predicted dehydrogenase